MINGKIVIREDGHPWTFEESLYMPDYQGKRGIDLLSENNVIFIPRHPVAPADFGVCKNGAMVHGVPIQNCVLQTWEPPGNIPRLEDQFFRNKFMNYLSCTVPVDCPNHFTFPRGYNLIDQFFWEERKNLVCMISRDRKTLPGYESVDLYAYRRHIVKELTELLTPEEFYIYGRWPASPWYRGELYSSNDLGGFGLECPVNQGGNTTLDGRYTVLPSFHYNICTENSRHPGYVTEKIFHAMAAGCIPIYLGATGVDSMIPKDLYVDLGSMGPHELVSFMKNETQEERDVRKKRIYDWLTEGEGSWWWSSVRAAKKLLWTIGKGDMCK